MQLIGMLDSPYVRRVAISLQLLGLRFEHRPISVFRNVPEFQRINPVIKAPSLVCDDGQVLMDSTLILDYAEALAVSGRSLLPRVLSERQHALRMIGLALAACDKCVQIVYERTQRPAEKLHEPWLQRVAGQLLAACRLLDADLKKWSPTVTSDLIGQAGITAAVAWRFASEVVPDILRATDHPVLCELSAKAESLPEFIAADYGSVTRPR